VFDGVLGEQQRLGVGLPGLGDPAEPPEEVRASRGQVAGTGQLGFPGQRVERGEAGGGPAGEPDVVVLVKREPPRGPQLGQDVVQGDDLGPVGVVPAR